jgi:hypothetical protein
MEPRPDPTTRPLTKREQSELRGYIAIGPALFRAALYLGAVAIVAGILRALYKVVAGPPASMADEAWWIVPTIGFAAWLLRISGRWTGGRAGRRKIKADLEGGVALARRVDAVDAIVVEEQEDEGPTFFLRTNDGRTMFFGGQELYRYCRKGFPWKAFDIFETPESGRLLDIVAAGERLTPSTRRGPLSWELTKRLGLTRKTYGVIDVDFESLRSTT